MADCVADVAGEIGAAGPLIALAWVLSRHVPLAAIPGTRSIERLEQNWASQDLMLGTEHLERLKSLIDLGVAGDRVLGSSARADVRPRLQHPGTPPRSTRIGAPARLYPGYLAWRRASDQGHVTMRFKLAFRLTLAIGVPLVVATATAQNPLIRDQFTADPTARVFEGRVYVYPSHDIPTPPGKGRPNWFCMEDYHVFSSENLVDWKDHGVIVGQTNVEWADPDGYAMWAPECVFKNGKYLFYFPATAKEKGFRIGVAIGDKPYGPFRPEAKAIEGVRGIDPSVLVDKDGTSYIYYSMNKIFVARLKPNMLELDSEPKVIDNLPTEGAARRSIRVRAEWHLLPDLSARREQDGKTHTPSAAARWAPSGRWA